MPNRVSKSLMIFKLTFVTNMQNYLQKSHSHTFMLVICPHNIIRPVVDDCAEHDLAVITVRRMTGCIASSLFIGRNEID